MAERIFTAMDLIAAIEDLLLAPPRCGRTHLLAIDGRAGAGKTTLASNLFLALSTKYRVIVIHMDEIYEGWRLGLGDSLAPRLSHLLKDLSTGQPHQLPIYDWTLEAFNSYREIPLVDILIIEGVGSAQRVVREFASATIWLDVDAASGLKRVLERDGKMIAGHMIQWQIDEDAHHRREKTRENADFILSIIEQS
ncbi:MAG: hypothetical protein HY050_05785 [Actinobacteria bacterium]|nr:hypothetical protein [Actinomycetota bacterium]